MLREVSPCRAPSKRELWQMAHLQIIYHNCGRYNDIDQHLSFLVQNVWQISGFVFLISKATFGIGTRINIYIYIHENR